MNEPPASSPSVESGAFLDALPGLAWLADAGGRSRVFNREWEAFTGRRLEGDDWFETLHPDDRARVRTAWSEAVRGPAEFGAEFRVLRADGTYRRFRARARPRRDDGGTLTFLGLGVESTDESSAREDETGGAGDHRLRACEERNRLLNLATHDVIYDWDMVSDRVSWNEGVETTFGYRLLEIPGELAWWDRRLHPDDRPRVVTALRAFVDDPTRRFWSAEYRFRHHDGRWLDVLDRGYIARDHHGHGLRMIGSMLDLTRRKRAENALRRSEVRLRYLTDAMPQLVWIMAADGEVEFVNRQWCEFTGMKPEEAKGDLWLRLVHPEDRLRTLERWRHSVATGEPYEVEYRLLRGGDGAYLWFLGRARAVRDEAGRILRWFGTSTNIEARKQAESALEEARARLRDRYAELEQIYRYTPVGLFTCDREYRYRRINERMAEINGLPVEAHLGRTMDEIVPGIADQLHRVLAPVLERGEPALEVELHGSTPKAPAVERDWLGSYFPLGTATGEIVGLIGAVQEVTERKKIERDLRASEERFRRLVALTSRIVWVTNARGDPVEDSHSWRQFTGMSTAEWMSNWSAALHPDDRDRVLACWKAALASGNDYQVEFRMLDRRGEYRTMAARAAPLRNHDGSIREWIGMNSDITERKRAEEALARSEAKYRSLFVNLSEEVHFWRLVRDEAGRVVTWRLVDANPSALRSWGKTLEEVEGHTPDEIFGPGAAEYYRPTVEKILREGAPHSYEEHFPEQDRYLQFSGIPLGDSFITTATDVTGLRKAVIQADVAAGRLREADRRKDEFLAVLSHELRNPLSPIRNSVYLLGRAPPGSEQARRALAVIDRQVLHMTRLIDDLLDVTRISRGKIRLQRERLDLAEVLRRTADDHREVFARSDLEFLVQADPSPVYVQGDATRLSQVIGNLLGNAAKFTPPGGRVELALERGADEAVIRVSDTGAGITPELIERLFDPFVQAAQTLDRNRGGLGLGLALVKGLAELHGGSAAVASEGPGRGSTFTVRLPLDEAARVRVAAPATPVKGRRLRRVLVVEDNVDAAETLRDVIQFDGHEVEVAGAGPEALAKASAFRPEIVICDIGLPGMDGYEVARALRDDPDQTDLYLVALSGYAAPEDVRKARAAGFDEHLAKPVELGALERVLADGRPGGAGPSRGERVEAHPAIAPRDAGSDADARDGR